MTTLAADFSAAVSRSVFFWTDSSRLQEVVVLENSNIAFVDYGDLAIYEATSDEELVRALVEAQRIAPETAGLLADKLRNARTIKQAGGAR